MKFNFTCTYMRAHADSVYMIYIIGVYIDMLVSRPLGRPDTGQNTTAHTHMNTYMNTLINAHSLKTHPTTHA